MDKAEYRKKQKAADRERKAAAEEAAEDAYRQRVIGAIQSIADQNKATEYQSSRADAFHRRVEKLTLRLDKRRYRLEIFETAGLWFAAFVGVMAIVISSYDSHLQTKVMQAQQTAMQGQLDEMKGTSAQTDQMIETNRKLAEAASRQAEAAVETVKTAQANMIASQRAWVGPRNGRSDVAPELGKDFSAFVDYQNSGREPGNETIYAVDLFSAPLVDDVSGRIRSRVVNFIAECKIKWVPTSAQVVYPTTGGFGAGGYALSAKLDGEKIDQNIVDGNGLIVMSGCFVYKTAGAIHRSSFCYFFNAKISKPANWNICDFGNDAD